MRGHISSTNSSEVFFVEDPEKLCSRITEIISDAMDLYIPSKTVTKKTGDKAWFNDKCRRASRKKRKIFRQLKKNNNIATKENLTEQDKPTTRLRKKQNESTCITPNSERTSLTAVSAARSGELLTHFLAELLILKFQSLLTMMGPILQPKIRPTYSARHLLRSAIFQMQILLPHTLTANPQLQQLKMSSLSLRSLNAY